MIIGGLQGALARVTAAAAAEDAANSKGTGLYDAVGEATLWGKPIPITWGTRRITGQLLQVGIQKQKSTSRLVEGEASNDYWTPPPGGGLYPFSSAVIFTTTEFVSTFAYCFGQPGNPNARQILRKLWFNGQLVYDINQGLLSNDVRFRFYQGDEIQNADVELNRDRYTHPVAYRGLMYVVFYEYAVNYTAGTGSPTVEAEFAEEVTNTQANYVFDNFGESQIDGVALDGPSIAFDAKKGVMYLAGTDGNIYKYRVIDRVLLDVYPVTGLASGEIHSDVFGFLRVAGVPYIFAKTTSSNSSRLYLINADTGAVAHFLGTDSSSLTPSLTNFTGPVGATMMTSADGVGEIGYISVIGIFEDAWLINVRNGVMTCEAYYDLSTVGGDVGGSCAIRQGSRVNLYNAIGDKVYKNGALFYTGEHAVRYIIPSPIDSTIIVFERGIFATTSFNVYKLNADATVAWLMSEATDPLLDPQPYSQRWLNSNTAGQRIAWRAGGNIVTLNFLSGAYDVVDETGSWPSSNDLVYDAFSHSFLRGVGSSGNGTAEQRPILEQTTGDMLLSTLLRNLAERKGYATGDITIEGIPDTIIGAAITEVSDLDTILEDIRIAYNFEIIKRGPKIKFTRRGYGTDFEADFSVTEAQRALVAEGGDEFITVNSEITSPQQTAGTIRLLYIDPAYNYVQNEFTHKRNSDDADVSIDMVVALPIIMLGSEAAALATRILLNNSVNGLTHEFRLPQRYIAVEPGDVVDLVFDDYIDTVRCIEIAYNADWSMSIKSEAILTDVGPTYTLEDPVLPEENPALLQGEGAPLIFDTTLITPDLQLDGDVLELFVSAQPAGRLPVTGVNTLHKAINSAEFDVLGTIPEALTFGTAMSILPDAPPWQIDYLATLSLRIVQGDGANFVTDTELNMLAGSNRILVGKPGRWEQIGFIEAAYDAATKVVTLTGIVRGLRGTEVNCALHQSGDIVALVNLASFARTSDVMADYGKAAFFAIGDAVGRVNYDDASGMQIYGGARMPWAPGDVHVTDAGGGDVEVTWSRRTRLYGPLNNGNPDVPLDEAEELYGLVLYRAGVAVRTVEDLTSSAFTYTAAMQAADGWSSDIVTLQLEVYQISALVGVGFKNRGSYDVE